MRNKVLKLILGIIALCSLSACGTLDTYVYYEDRPIPPSVVYYQPHTYYGRGVGFLHRYPPYPTHYKQVLPPSHKGGNKHHHHNNGRRGSGRNGRH